MYGIQTTNPSGTKSAPMLSQLGFSSSSTVNGSGIATASPTLDVLKSGATLLKCGRTGEPHFRFFQLTEDGKLLKWTSPKKKSQESSIPIKSVRQLRLGQNTAVFGRNKVPEYEHLSFSLIYTNNLAASGGGDDERTLDIVCKDRKEFDVWVSALNALLNPSASGDSSFNNNNSTTTTFNLPQQPPPVPQRMPLSTLYSSSSSSLSPSPQSLLSTSGSFQSSNAVNPSSLSTSPRPAELEERLRVSFKGTTTVVTKKEDSNDIYLWGQGAHGQLGHGDEVDLSLPKVVEALLGRDIRAITCGPNHSGALTANGEPCSWGSGSSGKLGHGHERDRFTPFFINTFKNRRVCQIACGGEHTAAIVDAGLLYCWGKGEGGRLGCGDENNQLQPRLVSAFEQLGMVCFVACGFANTAAITEKDEVYSWGVNDFGQLGTGSTSNTKVPLLVNALSSKQTREICLSLKHSACVTEKGEVFTWGDGTVGQLGHGDELSLMSPKRVMFFDYESKETTCRHISLGDNFTVALTALGHVYTWGEGKEGQLGHGPSIVQFSKPLLVGPPIGALKVIQISSGSHHIGALTDSGKLFTWGLGVNGRLGHGDEDWQQIPKMVETMLGKQVRQIAFGGAHSAATTAHGWVPDSESTQCMACRTTFTFVKRRHHCRNCGGLFCGACSTKKYPLLKDGFHKPVRVCDKCHTQLVSATK